MLVWDLDGFGRGEDHVIQGAGGKCAKDDGARCRLVGFCRDLVEDGGAQSGCVEGRDEMCAAVPVESAIGGGDDGNSGGKCPQQVDWTRADDRWLKDDIDPFESQTSLEVTCVEACPKVLAFEGSSTKKNPNVQATERLAYFVGTLSTECCTGEEDCW